MTEPGLVDSMGDSTRADRHRIRRTAGLSLIVVAVANLGHMITVLLLPPRPNEPPRWIFIAATAAFTCFLLLLAWRASAGRWYPLSICITYLLAISGTVLFGWSAPAFLSSGFEPLGVVQILLASAWWIAAIAVTRAAAVDYKAGVRVPTRIRQP